MIPILVTFTLIWIIWFPWLLWYLQHLLIDWLRGPTHDWVRDYLQLRDSQLLIRLEGDPSDLDQNYIGQTLNIMNVVDLFIKLHVMYFMGSQLSGIGIAFSFVNYICIQLALLPSQRSLTSGSWFWTLRLSEPWPSIGSSLSDLCSDICSRYGLLRAHLQCWREHQALHGWADLVLLTLALRGPDIFIYRHALRARSSWSCIDQHSFMTADTLMDDEFFKLLVTFMVILLISILK